MVQGDQHLLHGHVHSNELVRTKKSLVMDTTFTSIKELKMRGTHMAKAGVLHAVMMFTGLGVVG